MAKKKIGKIDIVNKALNIIPDTTEILSDTIKSTTPLVEKAMDRRFESQQQLVDLPNLIDLNISEAKETLEELGFKVVTIAAKADKKFSKNKAEELVKMEPKPGRVRQGIVVKLYYVTEEIVEESKNLRSNTPNIKSLIKSLPKRNPKISKEE